MDPLSSSTELSRGTPLGTYRVDGELGRGGSAHVLRAYCERTGERVAIKLARDEASSEHVLREQAALEQLARAQHPGVVALRASGTFGAQRWLALECLEGGSLRSRCELAATRRAAAWGDALHTGARIAAALARAHATGLVHGDLSPDNVLFRADQPVLIDWAVARNCPSAGALLRDAKYDHGTPGYLAPERLRGNPYDSRSDLYALGCLLYELFSGRPPFVSDDVAALARCHLFAEPPPPSSHAAWVPAEVDAIVLALLEKDPRRRTPYAQLVARRLGADPELARGPLPVFRPKLIERDAHLSELAEPLRRRAQVRLGVTLLSGEHGTGRTRLLEELAELAREQNFVVLHTRPSAGNSLQPLASVAPLLDLLARRIPSETLTTLELERLAPLRSHNSELADLLAPVASDAPDLPLERSRERLYEALVAGLELVGRCDPVCLLVDTLESAGDVVHGFLAWVCRRIGCDVPCRIVIATSELQLDEGQWARAEVLRIGPLGVRGVHALLCELVASPLRAPRLASELHGLTAGCPAQVVELAIRIVRAQAFELDTASGTLDFDALRCLELARAWETLPDGLTRRAIELAALAAASGRRVDVTLLERVVREVEPELEPIGTSLNELVAAGILTQDALGYRYAHEFQRRAAEARAPEPLRRRYHCSLAAALAAQPFRSRDYLRIGAHWAAGGEPRRAIVCLGFGARRAAAALAVGDAIAALEHALQLATAMQPAGAPWPARAVRLSLQRIELLSVAADHASLVRAELQLATSAIAAAEYARARSALLLAQSSRVVGDYAAAELALARSGAAVAHALETQSLRLNRVWLDTQIVGAFTAYTRRDLPTMRRRLTRMAESIRRWGSPDQRASYLVWRANYHVLRSRYAYEPLAVRLERHAFRILTRVASRSRDAVYCQFDLAFMLLLGDKQACAESSELLLDAEVAAKRLADTVLLARIATYQAIALRRLRDPRRCEQYAKVALPLAEACQLRGYLGAVNGCLAWIALRAGELAQTRRLCDEADAHFRASDGHAATEYPFQWLSLLPRLAADMSEDRLEDALATVRRLLRRNQARLAEPVDLALRALAQEWSELDDGGIARRLSAVVRLASVHGYV